MSEILWKALRAPKLAMGMVLALVLGAPVTCSADTMGLIISEFMPNPLGDDGAKEYVELLATRSIDFSKTPYSVIFANNGTASSSGWVASIGIYGFSITSGTVSAGDVVYVGGSATGLAGQKLRTIDVTEYPGDRFGSPLPNGVMGNGGNEADGVAVFDVLIDTLGSTTVPIDAVFYGNEIGGAARTNASQGYQLPVNDWYNGGKLRSTSPLIEQSPADGVPFVATGAYDLAAQTWTTPRTFAAGLTTDGTSAIQLAYPVNDPPVNPPPPTAVPLPDAAWGGIVLMGVVGAWRARPWRKR